MEEPVYYKDVRVGKGSALAQALADKKPLEAARIYWECEVEFQKHVKGTRWAKPEGLAEAELKKIKQRIEDQRKSEEAAKHGKRLC